MLIEELRKQLIEQLLRDPKGAARTVEENPKLYEALLGEGGKRVKYVNMSVEMEQGLKETAKRLRMPQGVLIGTGIMFLLMLLQEASPKKGISRGIKYFLSQKGR